MAIWDGETLGRFTQDGEREFAVLNHCIVSRASISVVSGTSTYTLPDSVLDIRRVTWKGRKLLPLPFRMQREFFQGLTVNATTGRPTWYLSNGIGLNRLKLFPTPRENVGLVTDLFTGASISAGVIVEYFRTPDGVDFTVPLYFRNRLLKVYVAAKCYSMEGPGQNLKSAKYFEMRWKQLSTEYAKLVDELSSKPRRLIISGPSASRVFPGRPLLPIDRFGIGVDAGN